MNCPACGGQRTATEFTGKGPVLRCLDGDCGTTFPVPIERPVAAPVEQSEPVRQAPPRAAAVPAKTLTPSGVVKQARAELKSLNAEIRRLESLKRHRDELKRLIDAATQPRVSRTAPVRHLRANGER